MYYLDRTSFSIAIYDNKMLSMQKKQKMNVSLGKIAWANFFRAAPRMFFRNQNAGARFWNKNMRSKFVSDIVM